MRKIVLAVTFLFSVLTISCFAEDGTYDATVTTESGSYTVPVEVEDGEVIYVHWPNGGDMTVSGAEIEDGEATGVNSRGDTIQIQLDDYDSESSDSEG